MIGDEFYKDSMNKLSNLINGKIIESGNIDDNSNLIFFIIKFTDGSQLKIKYDWIYEWTFLDKDEK